MKALSIRQPWASLIMAGLKEVENRTRPTKYRGPLLIHAATLHRSAAYLFALDKETRHKAMASLAPFQVHIGDYAGSPEYRWDWPLGAIIGQVDLVDCVQGHPSPWAEAGAWHWVLANAKAFDKPIPYPGRLGLFDGPDPDAEHLFKPHDGTTRRVCLTEEPCEVVITRPGPWGNPWRIMPYREVWKQDRDSYLVMAKDRTEAGSFCTKPAAAAHAVSLYEQLLRRTPKLLAALPLLKGKRLGCFCPPGQPCHGDVLVKMVNEKELV